MTPLIWCTSMASGSWVPTATERNRNMSNSAMTMRDTGAGPRYEVIKTYRQRGPMRQYRLTASTSFGCFRCGLAKTSRLVTVFREDWNRLLCNGCYGLLVSLHDIRAGTADDSERADALAEQLLALASEAEQREAMELLRIRSDQVDQPPASVRPDIASVARFRLVAGARWRACRSGAVGRPLPEPCRTHRRASAVGLRWLPPPCAR